GQPWRITIEISRVHRRGIYTADCTGRRHLITEPAQELRVPGQLGVHHLHSDDAPARRRAQVDPAHTARPQPGSQPVSPHLGRVTSRSLLHPLSFPPPATHAPRPS